jgi:hypothetical protein
MNIATLNPALITNVEPNLNGPAGENYFFFDYDGWPLQYDTNLDAEELEREILEATIGLTFQSYEDNGPGGRPETVAHTIDDVTDRDLAKYLASRVIEWKEREE